MAHGDAVSVERLPISSAAPAEESARSWLVLVAWLVVLHVIIYLRLPVFESPMLQPYVAQPLLWVLTGALVIALRRGWAGALRSASGRLILICGLVGVLQLVTYVLVGVLRGFGPSPYVHTPAYIALNIWYAATRLIGVELARWHLISALGKRRARLGLVAGWLLPWLFQVGLWIFSSLDSPRAVLSVTARSFLPAATENLLATFMTATGGPLAALAYRGVLAAFSFLSPSLPMLNSLTATVLAIGAPLVGWIIVAEAAAATRRPRPEDEGATLE